MQASQLLAVFRRKAITIFQVFIVVLAGVSGSAFGQNQGPYWPPVAFCGTGDPGVGYPVPSLPEAASCTCSFQPLRLAIASPGMQATDAANQGWWVYLTEPLGPGDWPQTQFAAGPNAWSPENTGSVPNEPARPEQSGLRQQIYTQTAPQRDDADNQAQQNAKGSKPTIYLIALKDHSIVQAIGLWEEGSVLYYVSVEYALNQVSDVRVDWAQSQQLNHKRGVELRVATAN